MEMAVTTNETDDPFPASLDFLPVLTPEQAQEISRTGLKGDNLQTVLDTLMCSGSELLSCYRFGTTEPSLYIDLTALEQYCDYLDNLLDMALNARDRLSKIAAVLLEERQQGQKRLR